MLGGTSLFGGVGHAFSAVIGATLVQAVQSGVINTGVNLYLRPMVLAGIIFIAVFVDALRTGRLAKLRRACCATKAPEAGPATRSIFLAS